MGRTLRLGQARGPSAAARNRLECLAPRLGQARGRAPLLGQARGPGAAATWPIISICYKWDPCTKLIGGGGERGGPKIVPLEITNINFQHYEPAGRIQDLSEGVLDLFRNKISKYFFKIDIFCFAQGFLSLKWYWEAILKTQKGGLRRRGVQRSCCRPPLYPPLLTRF